MEKKMIYEVEARLHFETNEEAYKALPFLKECLTKETIWQTRMFGNEIYSSGKVLRIGEAERKGIKRTFLGHKEEDLGKLFNVRSEIDEDITEEIEESYILNKLKNFKGRVSKDNIEEVLEELGYEKVLTINGKNYTGYSEEHQIDFKLMNCEMTIYPVILELEKTAESLEEAHEKEVELMQFIEKQGLKDRIAFEEPPKLLKGKM